MPGCAAVGCNNSGGTERPLGERLSFHSFPLRREKDLLRQWLEKMGRKDFVPTKDSRLCSDHFLPSCFEEDLYAKLMMTDKERLQSRRKRNLRDGAVPTEFTLRKVQEPQKSSFEREERRERQPRLKGVQQPMGIVPERLVDGDASMVALSSGQTVAWPLDGSVGADIDMGADLKLMEYLLAGGAIGTMASGRPHQRSSIRQEQQHAQHQLQLRRREIQQLLQDQEDDPDDEGSISKHLRMLAFKNPGRFMEDFDPERSSREMRKMNRRIYSEPRKNQMYDEAGRMLLDGRDICDCLDEDCVGCHFPCTKCSSRKCGMECRSNRRWIYMEVEIEGTNQKLYFPEVPLTYN